VAVSCSDKTTFEELGPRFAAAGQGHVFRFWDRLSEDARARLLAQAASLDLDALGRAFTAAAGRANHALPRLEPVPVDRLPAHGGDAARWARARACGEALLAAGRVAIVVVAGGQGSRLGFAGPKGAFPIGPVSQRSLFQLQAEKIRRLRARHGVAIPWYVMTSEATDEATRALFTAQRHFGLPPDDVSFFRQRMLPALDFQGHLLLDRPDHLFESPDGHGGVVPALAASGALEALDARGCTSLFYYQVDNPLVRIAEPVYLGLHAEAGAEVSCKVIAKRDPLEKVGHVARVDGRLGVVEYTEIDAAQRDARDARGELVLWAGSISIYVFETAFLHRVAKDAERVLPCHASAKRIPSLDAAGSPVTPREPNGWKLERFVFDVLPCAARVAVVETGRDEYSPLKNAEGGESPATARRDLSALYRRWLTEAGMALPEGDALVEIDQSHFDGAEDFRARGITRVAQAGDAIRIASGAST
jgi:UDP-N-acetylglucosamine/UDP-N-acetylgalactosamine diphosphorylase